MGQRPEMYAPVPVLIDLDDDVIRGLVAPPALGGMGHHDPVKTQYGLGIDIHIPISIMDHRQGVAVSGDLLLVMANRFHQTIGKALQPLVGTSSR